MVSNYSISDDKLAFKEEGIPGPCIQSSKWGVSCPIYWYPRPETVWYNHWTAEYSPEMCRLYQESWSMGGL